MEDAFKNCVVKDDVLRGAPNVAVVFTFMKDVVIDDGRAELDASIWGVLLFTRNVPLLTRRFPKSLGVTRFDCKQTVLAKSVERGICVEIRAVVSWIPYPKVVEIELIAAAIEMSYHALLNTGTSEDSPGLRERVEIPIWNSSNKLLIPES
jgi:hypothetical protein